MTMNRRQLLRTGGILVLPTIAGCSGNSSIDEIETGIEGTNEQLVEIDPKLEAIATNIDQQNWTGCFAEVEDIRTTLDSARQTANEALSLAEEGGHSEHVAVLDGQLEYIGILSDMTDEAESACQAGQNGDGQKLEQHWQTLQELDDKRHQKRREVEEALNDLR